jgi:hypothetical protein
MNDVVIKAEDFKSKVFMIEVGRMDVFRPVAQLKIRKENPNAIQTHINQLIQIKHHEFLRSHNSPALSRMGDGAQQQQLHQQLASGATSSSHTPLSSIVV